jgi:hypothetical protein
MNKLELNPEIRNFHFCPVRTLIVRLLREFQMDIFTQHPSEELRDEDERLDQLTSATKYGYLENKFDYVQ